MYLLELKTMPPKKLNEVYNNVKFIFQTTPTTVL